MKENKINLNILIEKKEEKVLSKKFSDDYDNSLIEFPQRNSIDHSFEHESPFSTIES